MVSQSVSASASGSESAASPRMRCALVCCARRDRDRQGRQRTQRRPRGFELAAAHPDHDQLELVGEGLVGLGSLGRADSVLQVYDLPRSTPEVRGEILEVEAIVPVTAVPTWRPNA